MKNIYFKLLFEFFCLNPIENFIKTNILRLKKGTLEFNKKNIL